MLSFSLFCTFVYDKLHCVYTYVLLYSSIAQYRDSLFDFEVLHLLLRHSLHVAVCLSFAHSLVGWFCSICASSVCCSPLIRQLFFENFNSLYLFECRIWCVKFHVYYSVKWDMRECIWIVESRAISAYCVSDDRAATIASTSVCMHEWNKSATEKWRKEKTSERERQSERASWEWWSQLMYAMYNKYIYSYTIAACQISCISLSI